MTIDSFYSNGKLHGHKGEDYAIHGEDYFIICDGCSSSKNSDLVARIQAYTAVKYINTLICSENYELIAKCIGNDIKSILSNLMLYDTIPLSTLIIGFKYKDYFTVIVYGDGVLTYKYNNSEQRIITIDYNNNAPFYPYYYSDKHLIDQYKTRYPDVEKEVCDNEFITIANCNGIEKPEAFDFLIEDLEYLFMFSDGIQDFSKRNEKIDLKSAINSFVEMKNTNGAFIQRRCKRQLKEFEKDGIFPNDDFSMAGFHI